MGPGGRRGAGGQLTAQALAVRPCVSVGLASDLHPGRIQKSLPGTRLVTAGRMAAVMAGPGGHRSGESPWGCPPQLSVGAE